MMITPVEANDICEVAVVERESFSEPWSEASLMAELEKADAAMFVCKDGARVVGWAGLEWCYGEGSVTNIAVLPEYRGRGIGRRLTERLIECAKVEKLSTLILEVRVSNAPAIKIYESLGFVSLGIRPNFYSHPKEDALMMQITLEGGESHDTF